MIRRRLFSIAPFAALCFFHPSTLSAQYTISTLVASNATTTYEGNGVAADLAGNVYATAFMTGVGGSFVMKVNSSGVTVADGGGNNYPGCGLATSQVFLGDLGALAVDPSGNLYIAQSGGGPLLRVSGGISTCLANQQSWGGSGIAADAAGNTYFSLQGSSNVWKVTPSGAVVQVAGTPPNSENNSITGCTGANGPALAAELGRPQGIALDAAGANLYIADEWCNSVVKVNLSSGILTTVAGTPGNNHPGDTGDGGPATQATLGGPYGVAVDVYGNVFISDTSSAKIREVNTSGIINTIAGNGQTGTEGAANGDGGPATSAEIDSPRGISVGLGGKIYIDDVGHNSIRVLTPVTSAAPPFGYIDTPINNSTGVSGAINVTGWALSTSSVASVGIYRAPLAGEAAGANGLGFISNAFFLAGTRPDVAAAYPGYPNNNWGWGVQVLTNELPGVGGMPIGNGSYKIYAVATDPNGLSTVLGPVSISVNNTASVIPFGTIDTPAQGATISGSAYVNFGWALTPQPNIIPLDGSTIEVYIDGLPQGHPVYNNYRVDIATLFPGYRNAGVLGMPAGGGAVGYFFIDTTKLANGLHTIAWSVSDGAGNAAGIGSRYFIVQN